MIKKMGLLVESIMKINMEGEYSVFFDISPHVKGFSFRISEGQWSPDKNMLSYSFYYDNEKNVDKCVEFFQLLSESYISNFKDVEVISQNKHILRLISQLDLVKLERRR